MADSLDLGLAFMRAHPAEAARVLERLPSADAGALFAVVDSGPGAGVLAAMLPTAAARILASVPEAAAVALIGATGTSAAVAILRHTAPALRARLLAVMPAATALAAQMLLGFPDDTVGAWTDTDIVAIPAVASVASVLDRLRGATAPDLDRVFVVDAAQRLQGSIGLHALLKAEPRALAGTLAQPAAATLAALMPLSSLRGSGPWARATSLPVLDRDQRLIGVLHRASLDRAQRSRIRLTPVALRPASVTGTLASSYWGIVSGLSGATLSLLPRVGRVQADDP